MTASDRRGVVTLFGALGGVTGDVFIFAGAPTVGIAVLMTALPMLLGLQWAQRAEKATRPVVPPAPAPTEALRRALGAIATTQDLWRTIEIERRWWHEQVLAGHQPDNCWYCQQGRN